MIYALLFIIHRSYGDQEGVSGLNGGWKPASLEDSINYYSSICTIPKISITEISKERFERDYKKKPFILTFPNGASDWVQTEFWTMENLTLEYEDWQFTAGKSIDIVYNGGRGDFNRTFKEYIEEMRNKRVPGGDVT